jgi:PhnB protein
MKSAPSIRPGFPTASPYLIFRDATPAIAFYQKAFGATELSRRVDPKGRVAHAEIEIGGSTFMLTSENPAFAFMRGVESIGDSPGHSNARLMPGRSW